MQNIYTNKEFMNIIEPYLKHPSIKVLENIPHHKNSNRLEHSLNTSYRAYLICKKLNLNFKSAAKAGILHDLYYNRINECDSLNRKVILFMNEHPKDALLNAESLYSLTDLEKNMILSHMWPASKYIPKYRESFVLGFADKISSLSDLKVFLKLKKAFISTYAYLFVSIFIK